VKDQTDKNRFVELRATGWSYDRIAKELKVSKQTLINWSKELSIQISNLRAIELEALQEKYSLLKRQRIEFLAQQTTAIKNELKKRKLTDVPTEKLFNLLFRGQAILQQEETDLVFQEDSAGLDLLGDLKTISSWKG